MKTSNCNVTFICEWVNRPSFDKTSNICLYIPSYQANTVSLAWQRVKKTAKPWNISSHSFNRYEAIIGTSFPPRGYSTSFRHSFRLTSEFSIFGLTLILKNVCPLQFSFSRVYQWVNKLVTIVFFFFCQWWVCGKMRKDAEGCVAHVQVTSPLSHAKVIRSRTPDTMYRHAHQRGALR